MTLLAALAGSLTVIGLWLIARDHNHKPHHHPPAPGCLWCPGSPR